MGPSAPQRLVKVLCYLQFLKNTEFVRIVLNHLINQILSAKK